ncbi:ATP-dependent helicase, putative [Plasmodium sp. gorilla clade G2]|uniref:ATP-dependent helicase, putative n=1 Tax=Plasmodium sp. gorilla clade G2 TaxID=880535 RepID=UPI000D2136F1|nr:ATP-dependent helicase, putative [Plasmodium sp. gorilla clade G2]SOV11563.1 ATP-dependent helicase, putative [Plasmodium sp. gorilla clade G2]
MKSFFSFNKLENVGKKIKINFIQLLMIFLVYLNLDFLNGNIYVKAIHTKKNLFIPASNEIFYFKKNVLTKKRNKEKRYHTHSKNKGSNIFLNLNEENENKVEKRKKKINNEEIEEYSDDLKDKQNNNNNNNNNNNDKNDNNDDIIYDNNDDDQGKCKFSQFNEINKNIVEFLENKKGIKYMTKIQSESFRPIYEGKDIIGRSETGSGKTLAFALPLVEKLYKIKTSNEGLKEENGSYEEDSKQNIHDNDNNSNYNNSNYNNNNYNNSNYNNNNYNNSNYNNSNNLSYGKKYLNREHNKDPYILVLEPTRELSKQVENTFKEISQFYNFNIMSIYGGESYTYQENKLRKGIDIVTGTPGRIIDHIEKKNLSLQNIKYVVLDEADEMLNLGFTHDIERILSNINLKDAQVLLYSATTPSWIKDISSKYLKNPFCIDVVDSSNKTAKNITHIAIKTPYDIKEKALLLEDIILVKSNGGQVIIFTRTKLEADILCSEGSFKSLSFAVLHGNIAQSTREYTMQRFRQGMFQILIATDIASRGLDISNVDLVIQCFPPNYSAVYIHRAGRTGRANKKGTSLVLYSNEDKQDLIKIEKNCGIKFNIETLPNNEQVFHCASEIASKKVQNVNKDILPFFHNTAKELIDKANSLKIDQIELISRCLAIIAKKEHIKKRSLINGLSETVTLNFINKNRKWRSEDDIIYWINKLSNELNVNTFNKILQVKIDNKDRASSFFDVNENLAELFLQNFKTMSKIEYRKMFDLSLAQSIPQHIDLTMDYQPHTNRYQYRKKNYSYRRRPSYY